MHTGTPSANGLQDAKIGLMGSDLTPGGLMRVKESYCVMSIDKKTRD